MSTENKGMEEDIMDIIITALCAWLIISGVRKRSGRHEKRLG